MAYSTSTSTSTTPVRPPPPRRTTSRFMEAAMNSRSSIHPPPNMLWQDVEMEDLLDRFHEEANAPARSRPDSGIGSLSSTSSVAPAPTSSTATSEGTFGRFSRAVSSFFHGSGFSNLGKRKAGAESAIASPAPPADDRREQARIAYEHAKEHGLLPTPKVFIRPQARSRMKTAGLGSPQTPLPPTSVSPNHYLDTPQRTIYKSASKKDLTKQKKLSKRVSNLEHKLSEAKKELNLALAFKQQEAATSIRFVPPISPVRPLTPNNTHFLVSTETEVSSTVLVESSSSNLPNKIKKRKATNEKAISIYGESDVESEPSAKKNKNLTPRRQSTRLRKSRSNASLTTASKEDVVMVAPGGSVPPIPLIPMDVEGNRVAVSDDGFGGLSHEIF